MLSCMFVLILGLVSCEHAATDERIIRIPQEFDFTVHTRPFSVAVQDGEIRVAGRTAEDDFAILRFDPDSETLVSSIRTDDIIWIWLQPNRDRAWSVSEDGTMMVGRPSEWEVPAHSTGFEFAGPGFMPEAEYPYAIDATGSGRMIVATGLIERDTGRREVAVAFDEETMSAVAEVSGDLTEIHSSGHTILVTPMFIPLDRSEPAMVSISSHDAGFSPQPWPEVSESARLILGFTRDGEMVCALGDGPYDRAGVGTRSVDVPIEFDTPLSHWLVSGNHLLYSSRNRIAVVDLVSGSSSVLRAGAQGHAPMIVGTGTAGLIFVGTMDSVRLMDVRGDEPEWASFSVLGSG